MQEPMLAPMAPINNGIDELATAPQRRGQATICRLFGLLAPTELCMITLAMLTTTVSSFASMALPVFTGLLVSAVSTDTGFSPQCLNTTVALRECRRDKLLTTLEVMGLALLVSGLALSVGLWLFMLSGERLVARLRRRLYACYLQQDIAFFDGAKTGELMNRLASDLTELKTTLTRSLGEGMHNLIQMAVALALMLITSPMLTAITFGAAPLIALFGAVYGAFVAKLSQRYQKALADASDVAQQSLSSIRTVRSFAMEWHERRQYESAVNDSYAIGATRSAALGAFIGLVSTVAQCAVVLVLWFGCNQVIDGKLDFGQLTSFLLLSIYAISSLGGFMSLFSAIMSALGVSRRIFELLDTRPTLALEGGETLPDLRGHIRVDSLTFSYPSRPHVTVLNAVSLTIEPGKVLALCGPSGSGKSSVVALLQRWYDPQAGAIQVDGVPLQNLDPSWWRRQIALVAQEPVLFSGTVLDNLRYGRIEASRDEACHAATTANAHDFVCAFDDGYDTVVGERGIALSGGQKQRIAIARALLVDPTVLLLDEATSALDTESEALVQGAIDKLMEARTTFVIAHRLSTIIHAGSICVMDAGRIVEQGTHDELLALGGAYERLSSRQMGGGTVPEVPERVVTPP